MLHFTQLICHALRLFDVQQRPNLHLISHEEIVHLMHLDALAVSKTGWLLRRHN